MTPARGFRLQQVLDHKARLEELQEQELAVLAQQRHAAEDALRLLQQQAEEQRVTLAARDATGRLDLGQRYTAFAYIEHVELAIRAQRDQCSALEARVLASRAALVEVRKETRMLERLRERHAAEAAVEADRREAAETDEMNAQRYVRGREG